MNNSKKNNPNDPSCIKIVTVGDGTVGKTCLLITYTTNQFPKTYVPTVFDEYSAEVTVAHNQRIHLNLWDTAGQEEYDRLRVISYPQTSCFLLCFSIVKPDSFTNIRAKWFPEISYHCPTAKIVLVGTKLDLKNDSTIINDLRRTNQFVVSTEDAEALRKEIKAHCYIECSAKTKENLKKVFDQAISCCLQRKPRALKCNLL